MLEGATKRFWGVTWQGGEVEITSGAWGANGRAHSARFETVAERDAFVAVEIGKVLKKGYREADAVAPAADMAPGAYERAVEALASRIVARRRPAWLPSFEPGEQGTGSRCCS